MEVSKDLQEMNFHKISRSTAKTEWKHSWLAKQFSLKTMVNLTTFQCSETMQKVRKWLNLHR